MMINTRSFQGLNVFMSRNLVPPELFDTIHDALKQNGAQVFLCCDPSRNGPNDYHVISSSDHEKFEGLRAKGCKLVGPQCVVSCAKERRRLPDQGYTCCLAMDGVKVLVSGFETDEKSEIEKLVTSMGGVWLTKTSSDVSFVIVKDVMASKYKWALNILKKPIVTINWLYQCRNEHRIVPQDLYRVLPFSGLTICVTGIPADKRKEMQKLIVQNGGKYSPELTKKCTHLISEKAPEGDKFKVAKRWGHIYIVTHKWFDQSISRRACLNESSYPVQAGSVLPTKASSGCFSGQQSQDKVVRSSQSVSLVVGDPNLSAVRAAESADTELEATLSQNISTMFSNPHVFAEDGDSKMMTQHPSNEMNHNGSVAADSQTEEDDLYLSECRLLFIGFEASELRKLVNLVRKGGGSRYTTSNEKLTHIIVGSPSEMEKKEVRGLAALGVIHVVRSSWLEDCDREKRELPVLHKHIAYDLLLSKGSVFSNKGASGAIMGMNQCKNVTHQSCDPSSCAVENVDIGVVSLAKNEEKPFVSIDGSNDVVATASSSQQNRHSSCNDENKVHSKMQSDCNAEDKKGSVFKGRKFCFSETFPEDRRGEIIEWIIQGSGEVVDDPGKQKAHFIVECHGVKPIPLAVHTTYVSTHWIRSCLEDGYLLDVGSHILYSPLPSQIPLPGFQNFRFCVSQYEDKDRLLLRNLCFTLGAKFVEKLTKKVTHLLCKFKTGPKYEAAGKWGITSIKSDWIYECVRQNKVVAVDRFCPKDVSSQEAVLCISQFPSQAAQTISRECQSQFPSQFEEFRNSTNFNQITRERMSNTFVSKRPRLEEDLPSSEAYLNESICVAASIGMGEMKNTVEVADVVPDVAAAIEDLLEQTSKIHDLKSPETTSCDGSLFSTGHPVLPHENIQTHRAVGLSKHWINRTPKNDDICNSSGDATASRLDGFSETQTESQVVGYEEDLSGRQMIIDRVRTQGSLA